MIKRVSIGLLVTLLVGMLSYASVDSEVAFGIFTSNKVSQKRPTVIIDAGHGGFDGGAVAPDGTVEKDLNLSVALKLNAVLQALGYDTITVRKTDVAVNNESDKGISAKVSDIKNRVALMKKHPDALFVSIHLNKYQTTQPHGAQVFYARTEGSEDLAKGIQSAVARLVQTDNKRVVKPTTNNIYLLKNASVPAVIVECGFLSNPNDLKQLKTEEYQLKIATAIAVGILEFKKS